MKDLVDKDLNHMTQECEFKFYAPHENSIADDV